MGRSRGFTATLVQIHREAERQQRQQQQAARWAATEADRAQRAYERASAADEKERKRLYVESRVADVAMLNDDVVLDVARLTSLLAESLLVDDFLDLESLKEGAQIPPWAPGDLAMPLNPPVPEAFQPAPLAGLARLAPGAKQRFADQWEQGRHAYEQALTQHADAERERERRYREAWNQHQQQVQEVEQRLARQHAEIEAFKDAFRSGRPSAVTDYFALVLEASGYPEGFPQNFRLAYIPESKQLAIQYQLPTFERIPIVAEYKYVRAGDKVSEKLRPIRERQGLYKDVVAQVTVRTIHEVFEADRDRLVDTIAFNGHVNTVNSATGQEENPCLVTLMATRDTFMNRNFSQVDALACLLDLSASVSKNPAELIPVRPVLDFNMVDPRFVEEADVLSGLDQRPNLMELTPTEFESLITNLFTRMGLEARLTQASRDGGVDCVAFDNRPIFGGKVIIQAKRYKNTVGVSAVRDLFGSVHNEGASKGILVTTSGFGKAGYEFAKDKPLELISGSNLLYLLKVHADVDAKIQPPEHWVDPKSDTGSPHWDDRESTPNSE
jgi:restriction system protein